MSNLPRGFSFQITGGRYAGFYWRFSRLSWRVCLGWLAFTLFFYDLEPAITAALQAQRPHPTTKQPNEPPTPAKASKKPSQGGDDKEPVR